MIIRAQFTYSPLGKAFERQTNIIEDRGKKQTKALKFSNKIKTVEDRFSDDQLINLIKDRLKEIIELENSIKINDLNYLSAKKNYNFSNYSVPIVFLRDLYIFKKLHERRLNK